MERQMTDVDDRARLREALIADGFQNPPAVGSVWMDRRGDRTPGQQPLMRITSIRKTTSGWQARCRIWDWPASEPGPTDFESIIYVEHLLRWFAPVAGSVEEWAAIR